MHSLCSVPKSASPRRLSWASTTKSQITALHSGTFSFGCTYVCVHIQPCSHGLTLCALKSVEWRDGWLEMSKSWLQHLLFLSHEQECELKPLSMSYMKCKWDLVWVPGHVSQQDGRGGHFGLRPSSGGPFGSELGPGDQAVVSRVLCFFSTPAPQVTCTQCAMAVKQVWLPHAH